MVWARQKSVHYMLRLTPIVIHVLEFTLFVNNILQFPINNWNFVIEIWTHQIKVLKHHQLTQYNMKYCQ